jgi:tripartite-type tricarboxylate transporter receptor subunit TctC
MILVRWIVPFALLASGDTLAQAPKFPVKPVRVIVGFSPGGATDIIARSLAPPLTESLGQSVIVENRPGASSQIAGDIVAKSPPDGHTLMMTTQTLMTSAMIEKKTYPDILKNFTHVALTATSDLILAVNPSLPVRSVKELIALARARPGELSYASGGVGTTLHLGGELLKNMAKINIVHVPYKGEAPAIIDLIAGHMPVSFCNVTACNTHVQSGRMRALAVTGLQRTPAVPGVPTVSESGLPGFEVVGYFGVLAPAATSREIVTRLNAEINKALARPDIKDRFASQALYPGILTADEWSAYIRASAVKWGKLIQDAGIQ